MLAPASIELRTKGTSANASRAGGDGPERLCPRHEKSARLAADDFALSRRTRELIETFAPLAERAILGISQGFACTGV